MDGLRRSGFFAILGGRQREQNCVRTVFNNSEGVVSVDSSSFSLRRKTFAFDKRSFRDSDLGYGVTFRLSNGLCKIKEERFLRQRDCHAESLVVLLFAGVWVNRAWLRVVTLFLTSGTII